MNILLLAGGWSSEREVSLRGAQQIQKALEERGHRVTFCDPSFQFDALFRLAQSHDVAFINLHGSPGEDGLIQALLDRAGCPYQGSDPAGSFLALHKAATKQLVREAGLLTADWLYLPVRPEPDWSPALPYPLFVKSNTGGSSLHLYRADDAAALAVALDALFAAGQEVIIEPSLHGVEVTCGVLGEEALPPILVRPSGEFFDYHSKYAVDGAEELCPAPLPEAILEKVRAATLVAHKALGLRTCSRSDFILREDGELFFLEVNTIPGMTATSLVPREAAVLGFSFGELVETLLHLAMERQ